MKKILLISSLAIAMGFSILAHGVLVNNLKGLIQTAKIGRFIANDDGTVLDTKTNLIWAAKDNGSDINWAHAKSYCENYSGGGNMDWRMPTQDELESLYNADETYTSNRGDNVHLPELILLTGTAPWASETSGSEAAFFRFGTGGRHWAHMSNSYGTRALPVRSGKWAMWYIDYFLFPGTGRSAIR